MRCMYCDGVGNHNSSHPACMFERARREKAGLCVVCGGGKTTRQDMYCNNCNQSTPYSGYPGVS